MIPKTLRMRLLLGAAAILLVGIAMGWVMGDDGSDAANLAGPAERWQEPALRPDDTAKALASLTERTLWAGGGKDAAAADPTKSAAAAWRLSGIVTDSGSPLAVILIATDGKTAAHVLYGKAGDDLPDGSHIVDITKTAITITGDSGPRQVKLFSPN
jgi:hypothetical protein